MASKKIEVGKYYKHSYPSIRSTIIKVLKVYTKLLSPPIGVMDVADVILLDLASLKATYNNGVGFDIFGREIDVQELTQLKAESRQAIIDNLDKVLQEF